MIVTHRVASSRRHATPSEETHGPGTRQQTRRRHRRHQRHRTRDRRDARCRRLPRRLLRAQRGRGRGHQPGTGRARHQGVRARARCRRRGRPEGLGRRRGQGLWRTGHRHCQRQRAGHRTGRAVVAAGLQHRHPRHHPPRRGGDSASRAERLGRDRQHREHGGPRSGCGGGFLRRHEGGPDPLHEGSSFPIWLLCTSSGPSARRSTRAMA
jgi:hypothetical protein